jgi:hypothetical protein
MKGASSSWQALSLAYQSYHTLNEYSCCVTSEYSRSRKGIFTGQIGKVWSQGLVYMVHRPHDLYESDSSPCECDHRNCMKQVTLNNILHVKLNCNKQCYEHVSDTLDKFFRVKDRKIEFYLHFVGWFIE